MIERIAMKKIKTVVGIVVVIVIAFLYAHIGKVNPLYDRDRLRIYAIRLSG